MKFSELGIEEKYCGRLAAQNITEATEVQEKVIPHLLNGENLVFRSETGTGKTFAFLLPLIQKIEAMPNGEKAVLLAVVSPTFELSSQIKQAAASLTDLKCSLFIGGAPLKRQIEALKERPAIVVGTPARLLELARLKKLKFSKCAALVLDEADRLFSKEIAEETAALAALFSKETQFAACSATVSARTQGFLENSLPVKFESVLLAADDVLKTKIRHWAFFAERRKKIDFLRSLLSAIRKEAPDGAKEKILIFTSRADQVENIFSKLKFKGVNCAALHARTKNQERQSILARFKSGKTPVLITSDLSSRGLDIPDINYIIQSDMSEDEDFFVHRAGRTARAGKSGTNIVVGDEVELRRLAALEKKLGIVVYPKILFEGRIRAPDTPDSEGN